MKPGLFSWKHWEALSDRRFDAAVFALALAARGAFLAYFLSKNLAEVYGRDLYYSLALAWLGHEPAFAMDATHPPLYSAAIAAVLWLFRTRDPLPVLVLQTVVSAAVPVVLRRLGGRLAGERAARLAAVWAALDPALIFFTPQLQTEPLFVFMEMGFFLWLYRCLPQGGANPSAASFLGLGLWGGLSSLCRSVFAAYPAALGPALWAMLGARRAALAFAALAIGWLSPIGAWTARNWALYHEVIPISAQGGHTLWEGFTLDREEIRRRPYDMAEEVRRLGLSGPVEEGRYFQEKARRLARERPAEFLRIVLGKALLFWRPVPYDPYTPKQRAVMGLYFIGLFALALLGAWRTRGLRWLPVYGLFAYLTLMHSIYLTTLRYRLPLEPFLCLWAAAGAASLLWPKKN